MTGHVKDAGVWKELTEIHVKDAGTWKPVSEAYVRDAGVWKLWFSSGGINITNGSASDTASGVSRTYTAGFRFNSSGQLETLINASYANKASDEWQDPVGGVTSSDYEVRATEVSKTGTGTTSGTMNTWLGMGTTREWKISNLFTGIDAGTWVVDFEIRPTSGAVVATARLTMNIEYLA